MRGTEACYARAREGNAQGRRRAVWIIRPSDLDTI